MARQRMDCIHLTETAGGYEFQVESSNYRLRFEDGAWVLVESGSRMLFESFNEAMHFALEGGAWFP